MKYLIFVIFVVFFIIKFSESFDCSADTKNAESRLKHSLICTYDKSIRPVDSHNKTTNLRMKFIVKNFDFDERGQTITINSWMVMSWIDNHLSWKPTDFNNISMLVWPANEIWLPDISLYNADIEQGMDVCHKSTCLVFSTGRVSCVPPCSHKALCDGDFTKWPFDRQNCSLHMGSWVSPGEQIRYVTERISVSSEYTYSHNQWKLISSNIKHDPGKVICCPNQTYPTLKLTFIIERHSSTHSAVILAPALIMIAINLIALWLEPGCSERLFLYGLNLLSHFFFIQQISWYVPQNGEQCPNVVIFFRDTLVITTILLLNTVITRSIAQFQSSVPIWIDIITNKITTNIIGKYFITSNLNEHTIPLDIESTDDNIRLVETKINDNTKFNSIWKIFAKIIDRLLFIIITIAYIIMVFTLIPESYDDTPNLEKPQIDS